MCKIVAMAYKPLVATVKGSNPELFLIGEIDFQNTPSSFMKTSEFLLEAEFRAKLLELGVPADAIDAVVAEARQNAA
jgi:hypothetical protein